MTIEKEPYEILIRFAGGKVVGAHVKDLVTFTDKETGEKHVHEGKPRDISVEECGALLGEKSAAMLGQITALTSDHQSAVQELELTTQERDRLASEKREVERHRDQLLGKVAELEKAAAPSPEA